jgi:hypothetical protein
MPRAANAPAALVRDAISANASYLKAVTMAELARAKRNKAIQAAVKGGISKAEVSRLLGTSHQRIRQIVSENR